MRIWIVNPYGGLPTEGWRAYRSTLIAHALVAAGHDVVWWVSNFDHRAKTFRATATERRTMSPGFDVEIVPAPGYRGHISLARIRYEQTFARNFAARAATQPEPDVLILAEPALFTSGPVLRYLHARKTRLIVDIIDLWPELFRIAVPRAGRGIASPAFAPLRARRDRLMRRADGIVAVSSDYLDIVPAGATPLREVVYWGVAVAEVAAGVDRARHQIDRDNPGRPVAAVYAGTLGDNYDIMTILDAATLLEERGVPLDVHIAGAGPRAEDIARVIRERRLGRVTFHGSLDAAALAEIYARSDIALSSYVRDSTVSMPIKAYDYLAAGLALVNSLERDLGRFVREREVGVQYAPQDATALAAALHRLATDDALRARCRRNARALAAEFDVGRQYGKFVRLIETLRN